MTKINIVDGTNGVKPSGFYVYIHRRLTDGLVMHVGKGKGARYKSGSGRNAYWKRVAGKHGISAEILRDGLTEDDAFSLERELILAYRIEGQPLTNFTDGGGGISGWRHSEETKKSISMHSRTQIRTEKQMAALRVNDGKPIQPAAKKKMSEAKIGSKSPKFDWRIHEFKHECHGVFIGLQYDFRMKYGVHSSQLSHVINGRYSSASGWTYCGSHGMASKHNGGN